MRISDWSSDVCSSDLRTAEVRITSLRPQTIRLRAWHGIESATISNGTLKRAPRAGEDSCDIMLPPNQTVTLGLRLASSRARRWAQPKADCAPPRAGPAGRSEERRVGKACERTCRSCGCLLSSKQNKQPDTGNAET